MEMATATATEMALVMAVEMASVMVVTMAGCKLSELESLSYDLE
jgi:hypothetical protein